VRGLFLLVEAEPLGRPGADEADEVGGDAIGGLLDELVPRAFRQPDGFADVHDVAAVAASTRQREHDGRAGARCQDERAGRQFPRNPLPLGVLAAHAVRTPVDLHGNDTALAQVRRQRQAGKRVIAHFHDAEQGGARECCVQLPSGTIAFLAHDDGGGGVALPAQRSEGDFPTGGVRGGDDRAAAFGERLLEQMQAVRLDLDQRLCTLGGREGVGEAVGKADIRSGDFQGIANQASFAMDGAELSVKGGALPGRPQRESETDGRRGPTSEPRGAMHGAGAGELAPERRVPTECLVKRTHLDRAVVGEPTEEIKHPCELQHPTGDSMVCCGAFMVRGTA